MNNILETLNIKGFDVHILISQDAENPLDWGSATLLTAHRRYTFGGDRLPFDANSIEEAWDSGQLGYIYETRSNIRAEYRVQRISPKREQAIIERLRHTLQLLEYWVNGDVYAWEIPALDEYGGGFYGWDHDTSGLLEYATDAIDAHLRQERQKRYARLKQLLRDHVPLYLRPALLAAL